MIRITLIETVYPAPADDEEDYCPDGEASLREEEVSFRELVDLLRDYSQPSSVRCPGPFDWASRPDSEQDYRTGEWTEYSLHYAHNNVPRTLKYWRKAWCVAGLCR